MRTSPRLHLAPFLLWLVVPAFVAAADVPEPDGIEELSVDAARQLAAEFPGATVEIPIRSGGRQRITAALVLPRLRTLDPEAAAALAEFKGKSLLLDGLSELTPETAKALTAFKGSLISLAGLTELSPEAAAALVGSRRDRLRLDGLTRLSPEVARSLARCDVRSLGLDGITTLEPETAAVMMGFAAPTVSLAGLADVIDRRSALDRETAFLFALVAARDRHPLTSSWPVRLGGIEVLEGAAGVETARMLARADRGLLLPSLRRISPEAARVLAAFKGGDLELPALVEIEPAAAEALAACPARLVMVGLRKRFGGLPALTADDVPLVRLMSREQVGARLESLESLDTPQAVVTARALAAATTSIALPRVRRISVAAARELAAFKGNVLALDGLMDLAPDEAEALAAVQASQVRLNGLRELSPETAAALAHCGIPETTDLHLDGLLTLSPEAAEALAGFTGNRLLLNGLRALAPEAGESLAKARCRIGFEGVRKALDELDTIRVEHVALLRLAARPAQAISLRNVTTVDTVATATQLAGLPGRLVLPGLRQVSPRTFAALIAKMDVMVPRLEAIEFTAEPDGSVAEDCEIPDGFEDRQEALWGAGRRPPRP